MALIRWQPFPETNTLQRDLNRLFDVPTERESTQQFVPLAEILEAEDKIKVNLSSSGDRVASKSEEPEPESDAANSDTSKPNKPDGGYGNTTETELWNDKESSDSNEGDRSSTEKTD